MLFRLLISEKHLKIQEGLLTALLELAEERRALDDIHAHQVLGATMATYGENIYVIAAVYRCVWSLSPFIVISYQNQHICRNLYLRTCKALQTCAEGGWITGDEATVMGCKLLMAYFPQERRNCSG